MSFKNWVLNEIRLKGYQKIFSQQYPEMPKYVQKQLYNQVLAPDMRDALGITGNDGTPTISQTPQTPIQMRGPVQQTPPTQNNLAQTIDYTPISKNAGQQVTPNGMLSKRDFLQGVHWMQHPTVVNLKPTDFVDDVLSRFRIWRFGLKPNDKEMHRDSLRFDYQRQAMQTQQPGQNEPVILLRQGNKYRLLDGYHRVMPRLVAAAPPDQVALLRSGGMDMSGLDFNRWGSVPINAYVGIKQREAEGQNGPQPLDGQPGLAA